MRRVSIHRRSRQLFQKGRLFPMASCENEISTVRTRGVKQRPPGQQSRLGQTVRSDAGRKVQATQYLHYLYPGRKDTSKTTSELESRLDVIIYHLDWSVTKASSRQAVSHGHISVNGKRVTIPSYKIEKGDVLECNLPPRYGFTKPYYSSVEVNHRVRAAIVINPALACETSVCNYKSR